MADLKVALQTVFGNEGGYVNNPHDPGGETKFGIAKKYHPEVDIKNLTIDQAADIYRREYWKFDRLQSQVVATKVFDIAVNDGVGQAIKLLQRAVAYVKGVTLADDGLMGLVTIAMTNACDEGKLLSELRARACWFYAIIELRKPDALEDETFMLGWMRRAVR